MVCMVTRLLNKNRFSLCMKILENAVFQVWDKKEDNGHWTYASRSADGFTVKQIQPSFFHVACTLAHTTRTLYTVHLFPGKGVYGGRIVLVLRDMVSLLPHL